MDLEKPVVEAPPPRARETILVIEDDATVRLNLADVALGQLQNFGGRFGAPIKARVSHSPDHCRARPASFAANHSS